MEIGIDNSLHYITFVNANIMDLVEEGNTMSRALLSIGLSRL